MTFQIAAPLLDACVLAILEKEDAYGYTLTAQVKEIVDISETTYDQPFQGRNRRYYQLTDTGKAKLSFYKKEWESYKNKIDTLLGGISYE